LCFDEEFLACDLTVCVCVRESVSESRMAVYPQMESFGIPQHLFGTHLPTQASEQT